MRKCLHLNFLVILSGVLAITHSQTVIHPYFARNGTLRCNCKNNNPCLEDGTCPHVGCASPYVGFTCQDANISSVLIWTNAPSLLVDRNDSTCLNQSVTGPVDFQLEASIHFIWVYLVTTISDPTSVHLELYSNGTAQVIEPFYMTLTSTSLLIKLNHDVVYDQLKLLDLPKDTCTLDVSIGRNLALSSESNQSSTRYPGYSPNTTTDSRKVIDGNDQRAYQISSDFFCMHTGNTLNPEWWGTRLEYDAVVNSVLILNRDQEQCRLKQFLLQMYTSDMQEVFTHQDSSRKPHDSFDVSVLATKPIRSLKLSIWKTPMGYCMDYGVLHICEIYIYGEFSCSRNWYGYQCEKYCLGCLRESCDPYWGCTKCKEDYAGQWCSVDCHYRFGDACQYHCPDNCGGYGECNRTTGVCLEGCREGFYTPNCSETCPPGYYGANCVKACTLCKRNSSTGIPHCDRISGFCTLGCDEGRTGDECETLTIGQSWREMILTYGVLIAVGILAVLVIYRSFVKAQNASTLEENKRDNARSEFINTSAGAERDPNLTDKMETGTGVDPPTVSNVNAVAEAAMDVTAEKDALSVNGDAKASTDVRGQTLANVFGAARAAIEAVVYGTAKAALKITTGRASNVSAESGLGRDENVDGSEETPLSSTDRESFQTFPKLPQSSPTNKKVYQSDPNNTNLFQSDPKDKNLFQSGPKDKKLSLSDPKDSKLIQSDPKVKNLFQSVPKDKKLSQSDPKDEKLIQSDPKDKNLFQSDPKDKKLIQSDPKDKKRLSFNTVSTDIETTTDALETSVDELDSLKGKSVDVFESSVDDLESLRGFSSDASKNTESESSAISEAATTSTAAAAKRERENLKSGKTLTFTIKEFMRWNSSQKYKSR